MLKNNLSLCIINKNDSKNLERLLLKAKDFVEEIVVVDTGSTDSSFEIAKQHATIAYQTTEFNDEQNNIMSFAAARNKSFELATKDYVFWLDTDDDLSNWGLLTEDLEKLKLRSKEVNIESFCIEMSYDYTWDDERKLCLQSFFRERIFNKRSDWKWVDPIHEFVETKKPKLVYTSAIRVIHLSQGARGLENDRNKRILENWLNQNNLTLFEFDKINYYLGDEELRRENFTKAVEYYIEVKHVNFWKTKALFRIGECMINTGSFDFGARFAEENIKDFDNAHFHLQAAFCYVHLRNKEKTKEKILAAINKPMLPMENPYYGNFVVQSYQNIFNESITL